MVAGVAVQKIDVSPREKSSSSLVRVWSRLGRVGGGKGTETALRTELAAPILHLRRAHDCSDWLGGEWKLKAIGQCPVLVVGDGWRYYAVKGKACITLARFLEQRSLR